jgi:PhoH-like ATPase
MNNKKIFVLDTNILIHEPTAFLSFEEHDVIIPMTVLEELDRLKDRKGNASHDARIAIKSIEKVFHEADPDDILKGVTIISSDGKERGKLSIFNDMELQLKDAVERKSVGLGGFYGGPDNSIIEAALYIQNTHKNRIVGLVTKDINMRLKAKILGMNLVEDYKSDQVVDDVRFLAKGYEKFEGNFWDNVESCTSTNGKKCIHKIDSSIFESPYINQYIYDDETEKTNFAGKIVEIQDDVVLMEDKGYSGLMGQEAWGIKPKNIQQGMAMDALLDENIELVILSGNAGSGKTLLALCTSIHQVLEQSKYDKIIVTRSTPEIAESIGYLPGTEEEKMAPWLSAISDSLEALHKGDHDKGGSMDYIMEKANIQFKSLNFMRGRSIQNSIVILDEAQNLTASQIKTITTRIGEGSKIIVLGNLGQIDSNYITAITSGLTSCVEKFKNFEGSAVVNLKGVVRSRLAAFAEENL